MIVKKQEAKFIPSTIWFFIVKKLNPLNTTTSQIATPWDDVQMVIRGLYIPSILYGKAIRHVATS
jgi:hypothetical protein